MDSTGITFPYSLLITSEACYREGSEVWYSKTHEAVESLSHRFSVDFINYWWIDSVGT